VLAVAQQADVRTEPAYDRGRASAVGRLINATADTAVAAAGRVPVGEQAAAKAPPAGASSGEAELDRDRAACISGALQQAVAFFDHAIALHPGDAQAYHMRANLRDDIGDTDGALVDYDQTIRLKPSSAVYHDRGILWQRMGAFDKA